MDEGIVAITVSTGTYTELVEALERACSRGKARFGIIDMQGMLICAKTPVADLPVYPSRKAVAVSGNALLMRTGNGEVLSRVLGVWDFDANAVFADGLNRMVMDRVQAEERLIFRMLRAWNFEAWGEPAFYRWKDGTLERCGLLQASVSEGMHARVLVAAADHLDDGPIDEAERDRLMALVLAERAKAAVPAASQAIVSEDLDRLAEEVECGLQRELELREACLLLAREVDASPRRIAVGLVRLMQRGLLDLVAPSDEELLLEMKW